MIINVVEQWYFGALHCPPNVLVFSRERQREPAEGGRPTAIVGFNAWLGETVGLEVRFASSVPAKVSLDLALAYRGAEDEPTWPASEFTGRVL